MRFFLKESARISLSQAGSEKKLAIFLQLAFGGIEHIPQRHIEVFIFFAIDYQLVALPGTLISSRALKSCPCCLCLPAILFSIKQGDIGLCLANQTYKNTSV